MKKGRAGTMTHDYKRHGTTTLFAALDVLDGRVIGQCMQKHRHQEFIRFLNRINREVAPNLDDRTPNLYGTCEDNRRPTAYRRPSRMVPRYAEPKGWASGPPSGA